MAEQFCPRGHDTYKAGRKGNGHCRECERFCLRGHDTFESGRDPAGHCSECRRIRRRARGRVVYAGVAEWQKVYKLLSGCVRCGYGQSAAALDFHHRNPAEKDFNLTHNWWSPWGVIQREIDKCDVLCKNCHAEIHAE